MRDRIGAPGTGISRRKFLAATGSVGATTLAGCQAPAGQSAMVDDPAAATATSEPEYPTTSPPEVVNLDEQGGKVTLKTQPSVHHAHPGESMGGPVELPRVWAFQADDRDPSAPGT